MNTRRSVKQPLLVAVNVERQRLAARRTQIRRHLAHFLGVFLAAVVLIYVTCALHSIMYANPNPQPGNKGSSPSPSDPSDPSLYCPLDGPIFLPSDPQCQAYAAHHSIKTYPRVTYPLVFDSQHSFSFYQIQPRPDEHSRRWRSVKVSGQVFVRQAAAGQAPAVDVEALSNDDSIDVVYAYDEADQRVIVVVDDRLPMDSSKNNKKYKDDDDDGSPCLVVRATVWLPAASGDGDGDGDGPAHLKDLVIKTNFLGIQLLDDVRLVVDDTARLISTIGSITANKALGGVNDYRFEAAQLDVTTTVGPITGHWTLRDRLHMGSAAGAIDVAVVAPGAGAGAEAISNDDGVAGVADLALLSLHTESGSIDFVEVARNGTKSGADALVPHTLNVSSEAGAIRGIGAFGGNAQLHTVSGSINVTLQPVAATVNSDDAGKANLVSSTVSGSTELHLLDEAAGQPLDFLHSSHTSRSGSTKLVYPASWVGGIRLKALSSTPVVTGKGVHVQPVHKPHWPGIANSVEALKDVPEDGSGKQSSIEVSTVVGGVRLEFPA